MSEVYKAMATVSASYWGFWYPSWQFTRGFH